jgi:thiamine biosynthesis lipoprotein
VSSGLGALGALVIALATVPAQAETLAPVHKQRYCMGTMFNIIVYHPASADAERAVDAALAEIVRLDQVMSHHSDRSELTRLNREGRHGFVEVDPSLYEVLERSVEVSRDSGGRFDVTIAPLLRVWKDAYAAGRMPSAKEIADAKRCVGFQHIDARPPDRIRFTSDCVELDLGGIGKGYAVDRAMAVLESAGIHRAVVNAGGSTIGAIGAPPGLEGWPVELGAEISGHRTLLLRDAAISTSQQRLRQLPFAPGAFGEIIDPLREAPTPHETMISVLTGSATRADALSTTLLMLPVADGKKMLAGFASTSALWISPQGVLLDSFRASGLRPGASVRSDGDAGRTHGNAGFAHSARSPERTTRRRMLESKD